LGTLFRVAREMLIISPARFRMDASARQVGFMSTQKRENRWQHKSCTERAGVGSFPLPSQIARYVCAVASGGTAPLLSIVWSAYAWLATKFLQMDYPIRQLVRPVSQAKYRGTPPPRVGRRAALGTQASPRSSLPHIPRLSGFGYFYRTLPQAPAGNHRRAERYDGKRDLYFQHAA
jgi:hypothetical protein